MAQIMAFAHVALVHHRTCLEHGEPIHAGADPTAATAMTRTVAPDAALVAAPPSDDEGHAHEHCLSMAHGRASLVLSPPTASALLEPRAATASWAQWGDQAPVSLDLLALAPKGSPPQG